MSDKKNFSVLGRIDEKFVEEADAYSVSDKKKNDAGRVETNRRTNRRGKVLRRVTAAAAAVLIVCLSCYFAGPLFQTKRGSFMGSEGNVENNTADTEYEAPADTGTALPPEGNGSDNAGGGNETVSGVGDVGDGSGKGDGCAGEDSEYDVLEDSADSDSESSESLSESGED